LRWEQHILPTLAAQAGADLIHLVGGGPALLGHSRTLVSPAGFADGGFRGQEPGPRPGFTARLGQALAQGGQVRAKALLWSSDLPVPETETPVYRLAPVAHPIFQLDSSKTDLPQTDQDELAGLDLPDTYLLYNGPGDELALQRLLDAWSWAASSIGDYYPLILAGLDRSEQDRLAALLAEYQLTGTARPLPPLSLAALAAVYRGCNALFHPTEISAWGDPLRGALACGKPVVGLESEHTAALAGAAGYLIPLAEPYPVICRALGAALITVVVEDSLAQALAEAAKRRSSGWRLDLFANGLRECYAAH
jgi:glycosyltransferase involved in cell wall biosynthesis